MILTLTSCGRVRYLWHTLASWSLARGVADIRIVVSMEPGFPECVELCSRYPNVEVVLNETCLGVLDNSRQALELGFERDNDFVIYCDDDVLVSTDVLEYFGWVSREFAADEQVICACANMTESQRQENEVFRAPWFSAQVWGTWPDRWEWIRGQWGGLPSNPLAYDNKLAQSIQAAGKVAIFPCQSRTNHMGVVGVHSNMSSGWYERTVSKCFAEDRPPQEYRLAD